jgi:hypothetical protein
MFTTKTALASLIGLTYLDDRGRPGFATAATVGLALAIAAAVGVAHYAARARPTRSTTTPATTSPPPRSCRADHARSG